MSIIYNKLENDFTQISNTVVIDKNISANAFRLYSYMCYRIGANSHWDFFNHDIAKNIGLGRDAVIAAKNNLMEYGYLKKIGQSIRKDGTFGACDYEIFKSPYTRNPSSDDPSSKNQSTNNTSISKDISKRKKTTTKQLTAKNAVVQKQEEYLSLPEWQELSGYETEKTLWYITQRKEDHGKTIKNTSKAIKPILSAILELKAKGLSIDDIMENIKNKNGCVYQTIRIGYFDNVFSRLKAQNSTNSYKNGNSYQQTETYTPKQPLNDDKNSKDYFSYRFNEDISVAFGYQECIELTNSIIEQKPEFEKVARTKALLEWLRTETKSQYNTKIKSEVLDIYKKGGYDVFVSKAIQENPNSPWRSLLDLLNN